MNVKTGLFINVSIIFIPIYPVLAGIPASLGGWRVPSRHPGFRRRLLFFRLLVLQCFRALAGLYRAALTQLVLARDDDVILLGNTA